MLSPTSSACIQLCEPAYVRLVDTLGAEHQINRIKVDDKELGEWAGSATPTEKEDSGKWLVAVVW